jgi:hypothetical protein
MAARLAAKPRPTLSTVFAWQRFDGLSAVHRRCLHMIGAYLLALVIFAAAASLFRLIAKKVGSLDD